LTSGAAFRKPSVGNNFVGFAYREPNLRCAEHDRQLGGVSPLPSLMAVKG
jgi:hypothetical protein